MANVKLSMTHFLELHSLNKALLTFFLRRQNLSINKKEMLFTCASYGGERQKVVWSPPRITLTIQLLTSRYCKTTQNEENKKETQNQDKHYRNSNTTRECHRETQQSKTKRRNAIQVNASILRMQMEPLNLFYEGNGSF